MKFFAFMLAFCASATVCLLYVKAGNTGVAALWGVTTGIWLANVISIVMEEI